MFVAWRDLRFAKGRFALMGAVIVLITVLVGLLSGLTAGLGRENTSAITALPADHLVFSAPAGDGGVKFTDSRLPERTVREWARVPGVRSAEPLGIATTKAEAGTAEPGTATAGSSEAGKAGPGGRTAAVSVFGVRPGSRLGPASGQVADGSVVLSEKAASSLGVRAGDALTLGGRALRVTAVSGPAMYSHTPVVWTSLGDWQRLTPGPGPAVGATVVALSTTASAGLPTADERLGTRTVSTDDALNAIGSYAAEHGSLQLMRGFLFAISALVIGAFFTVWTIQRGGDIAVLKALGASTRYLLRDALGQAVALLVIGTGLGTAVVAAVGAGIGGTVPFVLDPTTVLLPSLIMIALGAVGAALAIRRITSVDPLTALGSAR
ncbi:putative ABC transporter permease protein [Streptomyces sp. NBRC 110611]|uniref:ABC transporter permease n=1 Tax=Streptomyces sp. NBRC 110611 TaxID=1621259 RepID=UPI0008300EB8|nr:FtsX-like permease family protein [Streptomyces sp. NBRC 110611]GAU67007.1 putative ABC transporter permease protein [Streptomyces sp. NBRC 110611]